MYWKRFSTPQVAFHLFELLFEVLELGLFALQILDVFLEILCGLLELSRFILEAR
jgi:hypothetical protein